MGGYQVIVLDTHIWIWWVHDDPALSVFTRTLLDSSEQTGIGISSISCWEVAKLVEHRRLSLPCPVFDWIQQALSYPGVRLIELSPRICVESTQLPGEFHRDPADQIIVATARILDVPLVTVDAKILEYSHVRHAAGGE
jgi:PIN domain nuclease of toxin-antitoxin system